MKKRLVEAHKNELSSIIEAIVLGVLPRERPPEELEEVREFLTGLQQDLSRSRKTRNMALVLGEILRNPVRGKKRTDIHDQELAAKLGTSPQSFNRSKRRLLALARRRFPAQLRRFLKSV
jgi:chromosome condensin MukBEF complex kleisin-like MukF subunit